MYGFQEWFWLTLPGRQRWAATVSKGVVNPWWIGSDFLYLESIVTLHWWCVRWNYNPRIGGYSYHPLHIWKPRSVLRKTRRSHSELEFPAPPTTSERWQHHQPPVWDRSPTVAAPSLDCGSHTTLLEGGSSTPLHWSRAVSLIAIIGKCVAFYSG